MVLFEHTWVAKAVRNGTRISGFHQDKLGYYRKLGLLRITEIYEEGFYTAEVFLNGKWIERSFFPEHWMPDQLMKSY